jgi:hypothetical protein
VNFSKLLIEASFHLLFPNDIPLIPLEDLFAEYDPSKEKPYTLHLLMKLADSDV